MVVEHLNTSGFRETANPDRPFVKIILPTDLRSPLEIFRSGERAKQENIDIPLDRVIVDYSLVDDTHADELKSSMEDDWGQISPITVRAREENGEVYYDITDGYHRTEAKKRQGSETIKAIVLYGVSDEEMYDLRIVAANSVRSVQFPRIAEWISRSYSQTRWAEKGISVTQAFILSLTDRETSYKVNTEDLEGVKKWVKDKCRRWQRSPGYIYDVLKTVEAADPQLVKKVRIASGGRDREQKVTPSRLKQIALGFPGKKNFAIQNLLMDASINFRLYAPQTSRLVEIAKQNLDGAESVKQVEDVISASVSQVLAEEALSKNNNPSDLEDEIIEQTFENDGRDSPDSVNPSRPVTSEIHQGTERSVRFFTDEEVDRVLGLDERASTIDGTDPDPGQDGSFPPDADERYRSLNHHRASFGYDIVGRTVPPESPAQKKVEAGDAQRISGWWENARFLDDHERGVFADIFTNGLDAEQAATKRKVPVVEIGKIISEGLKKQIQYSRNNSILRRLAKEG